MPPFTPINKPNGEPNLYHAVNIIQNVSIKSISRWNQDTLNSVMAAVPPPNDRVLKTHIGGGSRSDSMERKDVSVWFRLTMIGLINEKLRSEGKEAVDPDAFVYLADSSPGTPESN